MYSYIARRLAFGALTVIGVSIMVFVVMRILPGDPLVAIFGPVGFKSSQIKPGKSGSVSANLKPGAYILICGVGAGYHASQGMIARFTVGTFDFTTNKWKA